MADLYLRKVILDIIPATGQVTKIDGLRIKFTCEKTNEGNPNNSKIEIYNLSKDTKSLLEAKNTRVRLQIGYLGIPENTSQGLVTGVNGNVAQIFVGNVKKVVHKIEGDKGDIITTLEVQDGGNRYRNARLDKGFPPGTSLKQVYDELIDELGLDQGSVTGIPDRKYSQGLTLSGLVRDHLDTLSKANALEWSIQDETLQIIPKTEASSNVIIELDSNTGLVGSPSKTAKGVEFTSLIQPKIRPGIKVKIKSKILEGIFKVRKVTHDGDSHQGDFLTKCEGTK